MGLAPLTPPACDLRDFPRMMLDIPRLRGSAFDATTDDAGWRAGLNLWMASWHSVPAASLEDDESALCKAAGLGRDARTWKKVRTTAMRGWRLCTDGRYYHATVAEMALEAWVEKLGQRLSSGAGNATRWNTEFDPTPILADLKEAVRLLTGLNPQSKAIQKASRRLSQPRPGGSPGGIENPSRRDTKTVPPGSQETGTENYIQSKPEDNSIQVSTGGRA